MNDEEKQDIARRASEKMARDDRVAERLNIRVEQIEPGRAVLSLILDETMVNGHGTCHGGIIFTLADTAFGHACNSRNQSSVAHTCDITYINPGHLGDKLTADCRQLHLRGRSGIFDATVTNQHGTTVALFRGHSRSLGTPYLDPD